MRTSRIIEALLPATPAIPFVILFPGRTGSSWLVSSLASHPAIHAEGERLVRMPAARQPREERARVVARVRTAVDNVGAIGRREGDDASRGDAAVGHRRKVVVVRWRAGQSARERRQLGGDYATNIGGGSGLNPPKTTR